MFRLLQSLTALIVLRFGLAFPSAATTTAARNKSKNRLVTQMNAAAKACLSASSSTVSPKIAIIGGGASGLAAARVFARNGLEPIVFEKESFVGGVWKYNQNDGAINNTNVMSEEQKKKRSPMYRGLRTNLPKELMRYRELPFQSNVRPSYVTHEQVLDYLNYYRNTFGLTKYISFSSQVTKLEVVKDSKSAVSPISGNGDYDETELWPQFQVEWEIEEENPTSNGDTKAPMKKMKKDRFDLVCVCNGHYAMPSIPSSSALRGIDLFSGKKMHSIEYDDPAEFKGQVVLCIGANASGSDITREISLHAKKVYVSDSNYPINNDNNDNYQLQDNIIWVPRTIEVKSDGSALFEGCDNASFSPKIDTIIFSSGYDYSYPFIQDNDLLKFVPGERRVSPLYEQLWHAKYPTLSFLGIPHSVVPFPVFELQAEAIFSQILLRDNQKKYDASETKGDEKKWRALQPQLFLPPIKERIEAASRDANSGGYAANGRVPKDTHYLGTGQWDYCRKLARLAGNYNAEIENYISTNQAIYEHSGYERKKAFKGGPDVYREICYDRDDKNKSFLIRNYEITEDTKVETNTVLTKISSGIVSK